MRRHLLKRVLSVVFTTAFVAASVCGCGGAGTDSGAKTQAESEGASGEKEAEKSGNIETSQNTEADTSQTAEADALQVEDGVYFTKGVYANYPKEGDEDHRDYFYVFDDVGYGHTEYGSVATGLPFSCEQGGGKVSFVFGGDGEIEDILNIISVQDGIIIGAFGDGKEQVFELLPGEDPSTFSAENYVNGPDESVYYDPNGWSITYDSTQYEITQNNGQTFIVYQGESAGTRMITVTYDVEHRTGQEAVRAIGEAWGDGTEYSESIFPGTEDVKSYIAQLIPEEGVGLYQEAIGRDYMDGALIFEVTGHLTGDEAADMEESDSISMILDSLTFDF